MINRPCDKWQIYVICKQDYNEAILQEFHDKVVRGELGSHAHASGLATLMQQVSLLRRPPSYTPTCGRVVLTVVEGPCNLGITECVLRHLRLLPYQEQLTKRDLLLCPSPCTLWSSHSHGQLGWHSLGTTQGSVRCRSPR